MVLENMGKEMGAFGEESLAIVKHNLLVSKEVTSQFLGNGV